MTEFSVDSLPLGYDLDVSVADNLIKKFPECGTHGYKWMSVVTAFNVHGNRAGGGATQHSMLSSSCVASRMSKIST